MDELEISGKRYLSSKRAAKENKYHADYIGQLIRAGKVVGTKVGRAWYVEAQSLSTYLADEAGMQEAKTIRPVSVSTQEQYSPRIVQEEYTPVQQPVFPVSLSKVQQESSAVKVSALRYIPDDEPLFPVMRKTSQMFDRADAAPVRVAPVFKRVPVRKTSPLLILTSSFFVGVVTFTLVLFASANLLARVVVEEGKPASVGIYLK